LRGFKSPNFLITFFSFGGRPFLHLILSIKPDQVLVVYWEQSNLASPKALELKNMIEIKREIKKRLNDENL
jgi:hypothetical protein